MVWMKAMDDMLICAFRESVALPWQQVCSSRIVKAVKEVVLALGLTGKARYKLKKLDHTL